LIEICRPLQALRDIEAQYPGAWDMATRARILREKAEVPHWPDWCYVPVEAWLMIAHTIRESQSKPDVSDWIKDLGELAALGAWRMTRGIYRFDPDVYTPLVESGYSGDIPTEVLLRLPEWGIYIETPGLTFFDECVFGAFISLDYDPPTKARELRMVLDCASNLVPVPLPFEHKTFEESFRSIKWGGIAQDDNGKITTFAAQKMDIVPPIYGQILPLILYLCSDEPDITGKIGHPGNPAPIRTKRGERLFAASGEKVWDVGVRMGAAIRKWTRDETHHVSDVPGTHASPRPHIRRAHWHGFWSGPRSGNRRFSLKWMPPIPVNMILGDEAPAVIHPVRK
jgi:hypothetical protein